MPRLDTAGIGRVLSTEESVIVIPKFVEVFSSKWASQKELRTIQDNGLNWCAPGRLHLPQFARVID